MVAASNATLSNKLSHAVMSAPVRTVDGARWLARGAQRFLGTALILAMAGIWLKPGAGYEQESTLFLLAVSAFMAMAGMALIRGGHREPTVEIEIDLARDELRLVRPYARTRQGAVVVERYAFADLGAVEVVAEMARMWDANDTLIAEVPLADPQTRSALLRALSAHGKL